MTRTLKNAALITGALCAMMAGPLAHASRFANPYIEFELPNNWSCSQHDIEWICHNGDASTQKDAFIVMAAKERSPEDTLDAYTEHLKKPQTVTNPDGKTVTLEPKSIKDTMIGDQKWVDAVQTDTELKGYFTRYLATVKPDIGIVVTYSIMKSKWDMYAPIFDSMIMKMKVFNTKNPNPSLAHLPSTGPILPMINPLSSGAGASSGVVVAARPSEAEGRQTKSSLSSLLTLLILAAAGAGGFIYAKKKGLLPKKAG